MNNLLIGLTLFGSLSMRTPNDINFQNKPDYEVSLGVKNKNLFLNRQWERQDGLNFVDDEYWFKTEPGDFYFKPQYTNKASRALKYTKIDLRYKPVSVTYTHQTLPTHYSLYISVDDVDIRKNTTTQ